MSPEQRQIKELQEQVKKLTTFMLAFEAAPTVSPQVAQTIKTIAGLATLAGLTDVSIPSPSNGQVLKYNGTRWVAGTDNT